MNNSAEESGLSGEIQSRRFRESYRQIIEWIRSRVIAEKDPDQLLNLAGAYGEVRWWNSDGVYEDKELEDLVESRILQSDSLRLPDFSDVRDGTVLIASELYDHGGHSRVVWNWMKGFRDEAKHKLLITRTVAKGFSNSLDAENVPYHLCTTRGVALLSEILAYCANAERIVLHIHPDDIVAAIAARILGQQGRQFYYYNHADHVFSFGISSADVVCELSTYGIRLNQRTRRARKSCYLGIPIDYRSSSTSASAEENEQKLVLSCGAPYKYEPQGIFFGDFIDDLLHRRSDVTVVLVGPDGQEKYWAGTRQKWGNRVNFMGWVSHEKYLDLMRRADVYVDSLPFTGGTAFPEALLNGKLIAGLTNPIQGYSPVDELRAPDIGALVEQVVKLLERDPAATEPIYRLRERAILVHSLICFRERVKELYSGVCGEKTEANVQVDTNWLENKWAEEGRFVLVYDNHFELQSPLRFSISYWRVLYRWGNVHGLKFVRFIIGRLILKAQYFSKKALGANV
jgi:hypothetical protein